MIDVKTIKAKHKNDCSPLSYDQNRYHGFFSFLNSLLNNGLWSLTSFPFIGTNNILYDQSTGSYKGLSSHPTWKTLKTWNCDIFFSRSGKYLEFASNVKTWNFNSKPEKKLEICKFLCFKLHFSRCHLQK